MGAKRLQDSNVSVLERPSQRPDLSPVGGAEEAGGNQSGSVVPVLSGGKIPADYWEKLEKHPQGLTKSDSSQAALVLLNFCLSGKKDKSLPFILLAFSK